MHINAHELSGKIDRPAYAWTPEKLYAIFLQHGCAVIRGAVAPSVLTPTYEAIVAAYSKVDAVHVHEDAIKNESGGALSGYELVDTPLLQHFLARVYQGQRWGRYNVATRRISGIEEDTTWQKPLDLHLDAEFHSFAFTTNFWIPFHECGVECPTMQLVPLDHLKTREYSGYTGTKLGEGQWHKGFFSREALEIDRVVDTFGRNCFLRPILRPGDLIVSSNWILHGSYRTQDMKKGRTSVEVRFIGTNQTLDMPHRNALLSRLGRFANRLTGKTAYRS